MKALRCGGDVSCGRSREARAKVQWGASEMLHSSDGASDRFLNICCCFFFVLFFKSAYQKNYFVKIALL